MRTHSFRAAPLPEAERERNFRIAGGRYVNDVTFVAYENHDPEGEGEHWIRVSLLGSDHYVPIWCMEGDTLPELGGRCTTCGKVCPAHRIAVHFFCTALMEIPEVQEWRLAHPYGSATAARFLEAVEEAEIAVRQGHPAITICNRGSRAMNLLIVCKDHGLLPESELLALGARIGAAYDSLRVPEARAAA